MTHDCVARSTSNHIIKYADDITVVGLIQNNNDQAYQEVVEQLVNWCSRNNLLLNVDKTKEIIVDFRKNQPEESHSATYQQQHNSGGGGEYPFPGSAHNGHHNLDEKHHVSGIAQQRLLFLHRMRLHLPLLILTTFYRSTIESIMTNCISVCSCRLEVPSESAEKIIGTSLPSILDIGHKRCLTRAKDRDSTHPHHGLFSLLNSGWRFCSVRSRTTRFCNSFILQAIRLLNPQ